MLKKILQSLASMSFGTRICLVLILFTGLPLFFMQQKMMQVYESHIINDTYNSTLSVVVANNKMLSTVLNGVESSSQLMLNSQFYYDMFSKADQFTTSDCLKNNRIITNELARQFSVQPEVWESLLYTEKWLYGRNSQNYSSNVKNIKKAGWDKLAHEMNGNAVWITGYDYGRSIQSEYLMDKENYDYKHLFTMIREMNFQYSYMGSYNRLAEHVEKPVLIVHMKESSIRSLYQDSLNYEGSLYAIANADGIIISSDNDRFQIGERIPQDMRQSFGGSGHISYQIDGKEYVLCYDTMQEKQFFSFALVPTEILLQDTVLQTRRLQNRFTLLLTGFAMIAAFAFSKAITKPVYALIKASERVAKGDFSANTPLPRERDFKVLTESFNHMETQIGRLIYENYEISLREKETQLMALSLQINPHFLYNTLNTINLLALKNEDEETADMIISLSEMLQYTFKNQAEMASVADEMAWVSNYLFIMSKRFDGVFQTKIDLDESLIDCKIPKLLIQPLVENSILHGFQDRTEGGILNIGITRQEEGMCITVSDNGKGMSEEMIAHCLKMPEKEGHIGLANVYTRLQLLYGEQYHISIRSEPKQYTDIQIFIPFQTVRGL